MPSFLLFLTLLSKLLLDSLLLGRLICSLFSFSLFISRCLLIGHLLSKLSLFCFFALKLSSEGGQLIGSVIGFSRGCLFVASNEFARVLETSSRYRVLLGLLSLSSVATVVVNTLLNRLLNESLSRLRVFPQLVDQVLLVLSDLREVDLHLVITVRHRTLFLAFIAWPCD